MKLQLLEPFIARHHGLVTLDAVREAGLSKTHMEPRPQRRPSRPHPSRSRPRRRLGHGRRSSRSPRRRLPQDRGRWHHIARRSTCGASRDRSDDPPELILPQRSRQATLDGVIVHRPRDLRDLGAVMRSGIPTTKLLRALCDLGAVDPEGVHPAVGHVVTNRLASPNSILTAIRMHGRRGRPGVPALREALEDWMVDGKFLDSELERRMKRLVKRHKLPSIEFHPTILRLRGRLPRRWHGDPARVRRLGVPRQAPSSIRGRSSTPQRADRGRVDRRQLHVVNAHPAAAVGCDDHRSKPCSSGRRGRCPTSPRTGRPTTRKPDRRPPGSGIGPEAAQNGSVGPT